MFPTTFLSRPRGATAPLVLATLLSVASVAGAEVLVLKDGSHIETRGPATEVRGQLRFTDTQGRLMSLRPDEVDVEATRLANLPPAPPAPQVEASETPVEPILVLTDADVSHVDPELIRQRMEERQVAWAEAQEAERRRRASTVTVYSTSWCPACKATIAFLRGNGIRYRELDVEKDAAANARKRRLDPSCGIPLVVIGEAQRCGFNPGWIRQQLAAIEEAAEEQEGEGA